MLFNETYETYYSPRKNIDIIGPIGAIAALSLAIMCFIFVALLCKNLYFIDHNWLIMPGIKTKIMAIMSTWTLSIGCVVTSTYWILMIYADNDSIFMYVGYCIELSNIEPVGCWLYYCYLLCNIKDEMNQNKIINLSISNTSIKLLQTILSIQFLYTLFLISAPLSSISMIHLF